MQFSFINPTTLPLLEAVLGGPLLQQNDARFLGMIYEFYDHGDTIVRYRFLPLELLGERLEHFGKHFVMLIYICST